MKKSDSLVTPDVALSPSDVRAAARLDELIRRPRFRNSSTYVEPEAETFTLPSLTVPDMTLTIRQMLDRHLHGGNVKVYPGSVANSAVPVNLERMSALDRADLAQRNADFIATTRGQLVTAKEARKRAEFDALVEKRAAERIAAGLGIAASDVAQP